jgi:hypothetical protein
MTVLAHARQSIRDAVVTAITGLVTAGARVYPYRLHALGAEKLPCLLVNTDAESINVQSIHGPALLERKLEISIRAVAAATTALDDELDTMIAEVEVALGNSTLGGLVATLVLQGIEIEMEDGGAKPVGIATLKYQADYFTLSNAPGSAI